MMAAAATTAAASKVLLGLAWIVTIRLVLYLSVSIMNGWLFGFQALF